MFPAAKARGYDGGATKPAFHFLQQSNQLGWKAINSYARPLNEQSMVSTARQIGHRCQFDRTVQIFLFMIIKSKQAPRAYTGQIAVIGAKRCGQPTFHPAFLDARARWGDFSPGSRWLEKRGKKS